MQRISSKLVGRIAIAVLAVAAGAACLGWRAHAADNRYVPRDKLPWEEDRLISIEMPDYLNKTRDEAFEQLSEAWRNIDRAAKRSIDIVADERVPLEQRMDALGLTEMFAPMHTVRRLCPLIDIQDPRNVFFREKARGRYPIMTVLKQYGRGIEGNLVQALRAETSPEKAKLLCEVLTSIAGPEEARKKVQEGIADDRFPDDTRQRLQAALQIIDNPPPPAEESWRPGGPPAS